ncbi:MAG: hypothetical protein ACI8X5_003928 [Planctomycetota bacterium]
MLDKHYLGPSRISLELLVSIGDDPVTVSEQPDWIVSAIDEVPLVDWQLTSNESVDSLLLAPNKKFIAATPGRHVFDDLHVRWLDDHGQSSRRPFSVTWLGAASLDFHLLHEGRELPRSSDIGETPPLLCLDAKDLQLEFQLRTLLREDLEEAESRLSCAGQRIALVGTPHSADATFTCTLPDLTEGIHALFVELSDKAGGHSRIELAIRVQHSLPELSIQVRNENGTLAPWNPQERRRVFLDSRGEILFQTTQPLWLTSPSLGILEPIEITPNSPLRVGLAHAIGSQNTGSERSIQLDLSDRVVSAPSRSERHARRINLELTLVEREQIQVHFENRPGSEPLIVNGQEAIPLLFSAPLDTTNLHAKLWIGEEPNRRGPFDVLVKEGKAEIQEHFERDSRGRIEGLFPLQLEVFSKRTNTGSPDARAELQVLIDRTPPNGQEITHTLGVLIASSLELQIQFQSPRDEGSAIDLH